MMLSIKCTVQAWLSSDERLDKRRNKGEHYFSGPRNVANVKYPEWPGHSVAGTANGTLTESVRVSTASGVESCVPSGRLRPLRPPSPLRSLGRTTSSGRRMHSNVRTSPQRKRESASRTACACSIAGVKVQRRPPNGMRRKRVDYRKYCTYEYISIIRRTIDVH